MVEPTQPRREIGINVGTSGTHGWLPSYFRDDLAPWSRPWGLGNESGLGGQTP
jgi:hypothetical protein